MERRKRLLFCALGFFCVGPFVLSCVVSTNLGLVRRYRTETAFCAFLSAAVARVVFGLGERVGKWNVVVTAATSAAGLVAASVAVAWGLHWVFVLGVFLVGSSAGFGESFGLCFASCFEGAALRRFAAGTGLSLLTFSVVGVVINGHVGSHLWVAFAPQPLLSLGFLLCYKLLTMATTKEEKKRLYGTKSTTYDSLTGQPRPKESMAQLRDPEDAPESASINSKAADLGNAEGSLESATLLGTAGQLSKFFAVELQVVLCLCGVIFFTQEDDFRQKHCGTGNFSDALVCSATKYSLFFFALGTCAARVLARWTRTTRCYLFPLACAVVCVFFVVETKYKLLSQPPWVAGVFLLYSVLGVAQGSAYCSVYWLAGKEKSSTVRELAISLVAASGTAGSLLSFLFNYLLATYLWHG